VGHPVAIFDSWWE